MVGEKKKYISEIRSEHIRFMVYAARQMIESRDSRDLELHPAKKKMVVKEDVVNRLKFSATESR